MALILAFLTEFQATIFIPTAKPTPVGRRLALQTRGRSSIRMPQSIGVKRQARKQSSAITRSLTKWLDTGNEKQWPEACSDQVNVLVENANLTGEIACETKVLAVGRSRTLKRLLQCDDSKLRQESPCSNGCGGQQLPAGSDAPPRRCPKPRSDGGLQPAGWDDRGNSCTRALGQGEAAAGIHRVSPACDRRDESPHPQCPAGDHLLQW